MVQLFPVESDTCRPDPVVVPAIAVFTFIIISVVWVGELGASLEAAKTYRLADPDMSLVLRWIKATGKSTVVRASVAHAFDLPNSDIPVMERGFRADGEQFTHVCAIGSTAAFENLVFFSSVDEADGNATVWQTDQDGKLLTTVVFSGAKAEKVPNSRFGAEFQSERNYFSRKAQSAKSERHSRVTPSHTRLASQNPATLYSPSTIGGMALVSNPLVLAAPFCKLIASACPGMRRD
jgi:hypothetical protein